MTAAVDTRAVPEDGAGDGAPALAFDWIDRPEAQSEFANCLPPLLEALGWHGERKQLAEALPHLIEDLDLEGLRNALANLNFTSHLVRVRQDDIDPSLMPCLFIPDKGAVRVVLARNDDRLAVFDGWLRQRRATQAFPLHGTAVIVRRADNPLPDNTRDNRNLIHELTSRFRGTISALLGMTLAINLFALALPLFIMSVYDVIIPARSAHQLHYLLAGVGVALLFDFAFRVLRAKCVAFLSGRLSNIIGNIALHRLLFLPASRTENAPVGAQLARLKEFEFVRELFGSPIGEALLDLPFTLIFLVVIAVLGGPIVFVPLTAILLFGLAGFFLAPRLARGTETSVRARSALERFLVETLSDVRAIKYSGAAARWQERFREASSTAALADFRAAQVSHVIYTISQTLVLGAGIATLGIGALRVMDNAMSVGALVAVMVLGWRVLSPLQAAFVALNQIEHIRTAVRQITALMRLPIEQTRAGAGNRPLGGAIRFSWVSHRYSGDADPVLFGVSFDVAEGETVAITGPNGSGKSTLVKLLTGLYRPQAGTIMIDGIDVRQMDPVRLRQSIGVVSQPSHLFYGTIAQNLRFSNPTASMDDLVEAAKTARAYDDIMALPEQFETRLTEQALGKLPAGFKQKLALARVFLRRAPIMIFDEATQGLDEDGDKAFVAALGRLRGKATIVIVTHRPSHMKLADKLILMKNGKVAAVGPPEQLLSRRPGAPT